jgi:hypothetical protein
MLQVEKQLARQFGISLAGSDPLAPVLSQPTVTQDSFPVSWNAPSATGDGELYKYQLRLNNASQPNSWSYVDVASENLEYDFIQDRGMRIFEDSDFNVQVRAVTTSGVSPWSDSKSVSYVAAIPEVVIPPQAPPLVELPAAPPAVSVDLRSVQSVALFASSVKRGKYLKLPMKSQQGVGLKYSTSKGCKVSKVYKTKTIKIGKKKKKVKVHTGWRLLGKKKKSICSVRVSAPETAAVHGLSMQRTVRVR